MSLFVAALFGGGGIGGGVVVAGVCVSAVSVVTAGCATGGVPVLRRTKNQKANPTAPITSKVTRRIRSILPAPPPCFFGPKTASFLDGSCLGDSLMPANISSGSPDFGFDDTGGTGRGSVGNAHVC